MLLYKNNISRNGGCIKRKIFLNRNAASFTYRYPFPIVGYSYINIYWCVQCTRNADNRKSNFYMYLVMQYTTVFHNIIIFINMFIIYIGLFARLFYQWTFRRWQWKQELWMWFFISVFSKKIYYITLSLHNGWSMNKYLYNREFNIL